MRITRPLLPIIVISAMSLPGGMGCGQTAPGGTAGTRPGAALPAPETTGKMSVEEALSKRRSVRRFAQRELTLAQVGQLAWAAQGITEPSRGLRTAPSAGALYPLELYLATRDGFFRYVPRGHTLERLIGEDVRAELAQAAFGQASVREAGVDIVITAVYERTRGKYGARAERYVHLEAGHAAQNVHLQAVALGLASVPVGAFEDAAVTKALGLPAEETPLYIIPVGYPAAG